MRLDRIHQRSVTRPYAQVISESARNGGPCKKMKRHHFTAAKWHFISPVLKRAAVIRCEILSPSQSHSLQSVRLHKRASICPTSSPSVFVSILQCVWPRGCFSRKETVYPTCEPNNSASPPTSLGYGLFTAK